ncbi:ponticulin-like protein H [Halichondria panicea]|uniref:ponticulin-like protein H n=1 Tax=Halichondria panicea TaxID=6063 RepID=UPI00312B2CF4
MHYIICLLALLYCQTNAITTKTVCPSSSLTLTPSSHRMLTPTTTPTPTPTPTPPPSTSLPPATTDTDPARATDSAWIVLPVMLIVVCAALLTVIKVTSRSVPENQEMEMDPMTDENEAYGQLGKKLGHLTITLLATWTRQT